MPFSVFLTYFTYVDCCRRLALAFTDRQLKAFPVEVYNMTYAKGKTLWWEFYYSCVLCQLLTQQSNLIKI